MARISGLSTAVLLEADEFLLGLGTGKQLLSLPQMRRGFSSSPGTRQLAS